MLRIQNIKKTYKNGSHKVHALNDVSLDFNVGDFSFILGESGSGKSTLLNILSGLDDVSEGTIEIDGIDTSNFSKKDWAVYRNHYVGFVFQEYNLIDHLTILENVELPLLFQGVSKKIARAKALEEITSVGLVKFVKKYPRQLSGGQQQRVSIARALVTNPKIIMADEPTGALDEELSNKVISFLKKVSKDKVVIVVTHDEDLANKFASRIIRLEDGKIISDSDPQVLNTTSKQKLNLSQPKMQLKMLFKFAKNNVASRMFRSLFSSSIVSIGYISIFLLSFLILGINTSITESIGALFPEDLYNIYHIESTDITEDEMTELSNLPQIESVRYSVIEYASFGARGFIESDTLLTAIPYDQTDFEYDNTFFGVLPQNDNEIIINSKTAEAIRLSSSVDEDSLSYIFDLVEGEMITIFTYEYTNSGDEVAEFGSYKIVGMYVDDGYLPVIYFNYDKMLSLSDQMNDGEATYKNTAAVYLSISKEQDIDAFKTLLKDDYGIVLDNIFESLSSSIEDFMMNVLKIFIAIAGITVLVSGILIGLVIYTSILERVKEIGILTAIGARESNIVGIFIIESGILGLFSSIIAIILSLLLTRLINGLFNSIIKSPLNLLTNSEFDMTLLTPNILVILGVVLFSVIYSVIAGLIPSFKSAHLNAIQALRKE
ncbi:MAG: ATP-binding cassette domain-containing protein [Candidatus Izemoplasma sp.]